MKTTKFNYNSPLEVSISYQFKVLILNLKSNKFTSVRPKIVEFKSLNTTSLSSKSLGFYYFDKMRFSDDFSLRWEVQKVAVNLHAKHVLFCCQNIDHVFISDCVICSICIFAVREYVKNFNFSQGLKLVYHIMFCF